MTYSGRGKRKNSSMTLQADFDGKSLVPLADVLYIVSQALPFAAVKDSAGVPIRLNSKSVGMFLAYENLEDLQAEFGNRHFWTLSRALSNQEKPSEKKGKENQNVNRVHANAPRGAKASRKKRGNEHVGLGRRAGK